MQQAKTNRVIFFRLIFGYATIGLVTVLVAWFSINRIENQVSAAPIIIIAACVVLAALGLVGILVTRQVNGFVIRLQELHEDLRLRGAALNSAQLESERIAAESAQFIDTVPAATIGIDADGLINEWNQTAAKITGFKKEDVLGQDLVRDFITEEYRASVKAVLENALQGIESSNFEFPMYTKGGTRIDILLNATTRRDADGKIIGVIGVGQDITDARIAQLESERIAAELTQFIDTANAPIFGIDADGLINEWNQTAAKITGFKKEDVLGQDLVRDFITEEYRASVKAVLENALQGIESSNFEFPMYTKGGTRIDILLNATTRRDADGKIIGVIGVGQDITDARIAQLESERIAAELTQFIDTANAPIFGIDADGLINEWNQTAAKITGFKKEDVLGQDLVRDFITEEYRASVKAVLENALQGIESSNFEFPMYTKGGTRIDILLNATTRRDADGKIIGVIGVGQDITETKTAQAALHQAQKMEVVGQLTGGVAHDFNNLLTVITGNLTFLKDELGVMSADVAEIIDDAQSAATDGAELTHRLLAFARQQVLEPKETSVNDLIIDTGRLISRALGEGIKITTALDSKNPLVMVDQGQLESALMNLCINARDAMQSGGSLTITSETKVLNQDLVNEVHDLAVGKYAVITVEDSGSGMSEKEIRHVFEPFYTTKEPGKGSGLGLSMVHGFVTQSNGTVVVESELGTGSKVKLYLPEVTDDKNILLPPVKTTLSKRLPTGTEKILVVDDEPRVRKTAVRALRKLGYEVIEANSAEDALVSIKKNKNIDLMFSDIMMPGGMSGRQLASIINTEYPKMKIQLTTGYENVDVTKNSADADFPLLRKPYDQQDLATALRKLLDVSGENTGFRKPDLPL